MSHKHSDDKYINDVKKAKSSSSTFGDVDVFEQPPPSFPESRAQHPDTLHHQGRTSAAAVYPIQPYHTPVPALTLQTKYTDWKGNRITIFPPSNPSEPLYNVHCKMMKPHMIFTKADSSTVGTVTFHVLHTRINTVINNNTIPLTSEGCFKWSYSFPSSAGGGGTDLTWRCCKSTQELLCTDGQEIQAARLKYHGFDYRKEGRLEVFKQEIFADKAALDEVVVTGVALAHAILFLTLATWGAATA
ncbi:MAG: hypothetical protein Q9225_004206 [Loekoesia sp. 1 TL-2023]